MSELSKITGAAEGAIFYHFKTKEDIFLTTLKMHGKKLPANSRAISAIIFTIVDGLVRFKSCNLYDVTPLYDHLIKSCRRMLQCEKPDA